MGTFGEVETVSELPVLARDSHRARILRHQANCHTIDSAQSPATAHKLQDKVAALKGYIIVPCNLALLPFCPDDLFVHVPFSTQSG